MRATLILQVLALLWMTTDATAKTLYVDRAAGNDSVSYSANSASTPWATLGRALWGSASRSSPNPNEAARAGDTVIVAAGVYEASQSGGARYEPLFNPVNSGSSGSPIIIQAAPGARPEIRSTVWSGPAIGSYNRDNIVWDGFYVNETYVNTRSDTGPVVVWSASNVVLRNLELKGKTVSWGDNHNAVRIEQAQGVVLENSLIYDFRVSGTSIRNGAAVMTYSADDVRIQNNTIRTSSAGIFVKGTNYGPYVIRLNLLQEIDSDAIAFGGMGTSAGSAGAVVSQNVIRDSSAGVTFIGYDQYSPRNVTVANNTFYGNQAGIFGKPNTAGYRNLRIFNNIIAESSYAVQAEDISDVSNLAFEHNIYSTQVLARVNYANYSLSSWRSTFRKDSVSPASVEADPLFADVVNGDFRLGASSPARNKGVDILDLNSNGNTTELVAAGAYVTGTERIGHSPGASTSLAPRSPTGVRVH